MGFALAIDLGVANTVAVLARPGGRAEPLLFDRSPLLPSAVYAQPDGPLLVGHDAVRAARLAPERYEPHPALRADTGTVPPGTGVPVGEVVAAILGRVDAQARRVTGGDLGAVVLTCPAGWDADRQAMLATAALSAGLGDVCVEPEPVAAARELGVGATPVLVYDLGATLDVSVVRAGEVLATERLVDAGGLGLDAALRTRLDDDVPDPVVRQRLSAPITDRDRRAAGQLSADVRAAREVLSRTRRTYVPVPLLGTAVPVTRAQAEATAGPLLARTVEAATAVARAAGLTLPVPVLLVGGGSRMPLVAEVLRRELGADPITCEQPELAAARGALAGPAGATRSTVGEPVDPAVERRRAEADRAARVARLLGQAEELTRDLTDPQDRAPALAHLAAAVAAGDPDRARELAAEADRLARACPDEDARCDTLGTVVVALAAGPVPGLEALATAAARTALDAADRYQRVSAVTDVATGLAAVRPDRAAALIEVSDLLAGGIADGAERADATLGVLQAAALVAPDRAVALARPLADPDLRAPALASAAVTLLDTDPDRGAALAAEAEQEVRAAGTDEAWLWVSALLALRAGRRPDAAGRTVAERVAYDREDQAGQVWLLGCAATLAADVGRADRLAADAVLQARAGVAPAAAGTVVATARLLALPAPERAEQLAAVAVRLVAVDRGAGTDQRGIGAVAAGVADLARIVGSGAFHQQDMWR